MMNLKKQNSITLNIFLSSGNISAVLIKTPVIVRCLKVRLWMQRDKWILNCFVCHVSLRWNCDLDPTDRIFEPSRIVTMLLFYMTVKKYCCKPDSSTYTLNRVLISWYPRWILTQDKVQNGRIFSDPWFWHLCCSSVNNSFVLYWYLTKNKKTGRLEGGFWIFLD